MKKKTLTLHRETLIAMNREGLSQANGGLRRTIAPCASIDQMCEFTAGAEFSCFSGCLVCGG